MGDRICPVCGYKLPEHESVCLQCGFKFVGSTESFTPVSNPHNSSTAEPCVETSLKIIIVDGFSKDEVFHLDRPRLTIGRDPKCDIFLNDMTVSRVHSIISCADGVVSIADNGSLNGTWVDGSIVERAVLVPECVVQIGTFNMIVKSSLGE